MYEYMYYCNSFETLDVTFRQTDTYIIERGIDKERGREGGAWNFYEFCYLNPYITQLYELYYLHILYED